MKRWLIFSFVYCLILQTSSSAQQNRFLYIQTENKQAFYVNVNNNILSSSASGYLIIPKLQEGTYQLNIGFPKNEWPRQLISYKVGNKDEGVLLKNFGESGWGFYNLQNSETTMASGSKALPTSTGNEDDDSFTKVLSQVVNTPDLGIKEKTPDPIPVLVPETNPVSIIESQKSVVKRLSENINDQGREFTYVADGDTVNIFIPSSLTITASPEEKVDPIVAKADLPVEQTVASQPKPVEDSSGALEEKTENDSLPLPEVPIKKESGISMVNSDCRGTANDEDFMKLRKKMASEKNEVKMVVVAKKAFKSKCYSTAQLKNLSVLFLNDSGRFQFFESAYPFVVDSNNFAGLQSLLTDPYYITRFEALTRR